MNNQKTQVLILIVLAIGVGFYIQSEVSAWPTKEELVLQEYKAIMENIRKATR